MYELDVVASDNPENENITGTYDTLDDVKREEEYTDIENKIEMESKTETCKKSVNKTSLRKVARYLLVIAIIVLLVIALFVVSYVLLSTKDTDTKRCEELRAISNGTIVNITGFNHGDTHSFKCMNGSKVNGPSIITCLSSDKWSATPACVPKQCGKYVAPSHAVVIPNLVGREVGTEIQIKCEEGYILKGEKYVVCQSNEIWTESPLCKPANCGHPVNVTNGKLSGYSDALYNSTFSVICNEGYELKGSTRVTCETNGQWSDIPSCEPVQCGVPHIPENGSLILLSGTTYQATASIKCGVGFDIIGNLRITCSADGTWTENPKCVPRARDCLDVRRINNITESGIYNITLWKSGHTIEVYCDQVTDGGGWTVFQYRFDGSVDFYRTFAECENGFGNLTGEFWLGLKYVEEMASLNLTELRIDLSAGDGSTTYETFKNFFLVKERSYELHFDESSSDAAEKKDLRYNNGCQFSTFDHDVDKYWANCAVSDKGSWWYNVCTYANLNGHYITPGTVHADREYRGMIYYTFKQFQSLKTSKMMLRRS